MKDSAVGVILEFRTIVQAAPKLLRCQKINVNFVKFISEICDKNIFYKTCGIGCINYL